MKPAWDQLGDKFAHSTTVLIGDVDCTVEKELCQQYGVTGYPDIKYFDAVARVIADYEGPRDFEPMKKFAIENLMPSCSHANMDLCNEEETATLERFLAMSAEERKKILDDVDQAEAGLEAKFQEDFAEMKVTQTKLIAAKDAVLTAVLTPELKVLKTIKG